MIVLRDESNNNFGGKVIISLLLSSFLKNMKIVVHFGILILRNLLISLFFSACQGEKSERPAATDLAVEEDSLQFLSEPLVTDLYTADPSAHVFNDTLYIYPSHDIEAGIPEDDLGSHFAMRDYHVFSMASADGPVQGWTNHHSIVAFEGRWYLFYHDTELSGQTHLRNIKMTGLTHNADRTIETIDPYENN